MKRLEILVPSNAYKLVVQAKTISDAVRCAALSFADVSPVKGRRQSYSGSFLVITESGRRFHAHGKATINLHTAHEDAVAYRYQCGCPLCESLVMQGRRKGIGPLDYRAIALPRVEREGGAA
jgi:hypothetical protein